MCDSPTANDEEQVEIEEVADEIIASHRHSDQAQPQAQSVSP